MAKLKKYNAGIKQFVLFLTVAAAVCCSRPTYQVTKIEGKEIPVTAIAGTDSLIEKYVQPYRDSLEKDLNTVIAYSPQTLDKSQGKWQTPIGNLMADAALSAGNFVFVANEKKKVDMSLLNFGGIRSIIPKGNVTVRTAFEIMPFENSLIVAELRGVDIRDMTEYIIKEKKAHPVAGLTFTIENGKATNIMVANAPIDDDKIYYVVTSDYLIAGGDNMTFFGRAFKTYDISYKLRNALIDYFKEIDTIPVRNDIRIKTQ